MAKHYKVMKFMVCDLVNEECGDTWPYNECMPKPDCKNCDVYQDWKEAGGQGTEVVDER